MDKIPHASTALRRDMLRLCHTPPASISVAHGLESTLVGMLGEISIPSILIDACSTGTRGDFLCVLYLCSGILLSLPTPQLLQGEGTICISGQTYVVGWE